MPVYASDSNRLSRTARNSARRESSVDGTDQSDANKSSLDPLGDTLQTVDDLWHPRFDADRTSSPSDSKFPSRDDRTLPQEGARESVRSYNSTSSSQDIRWRSLPTPEAKASPKEMSLLNGKSESVMTESREGTPFETSPKLSQPPAKITRRTRPARKPIPISKTTSDSEAMGSKESKVDDRNSSIRSSVQRPLDSTDSAGRYSTPTSSPAIVSSLGITPPGSLSLRQEFEFARPDLDVSPDRQSGSARSITGTLSIPGRSHSRGKSNTALHILHSFPAVPDGSNNNIDVFKERSWTGTHSISSLPAVPPHTDFRDTLAVPPLTTAHYACYHSHRSMQLSRNIYAPVPCMTCHQDDQDLRWTCTWCCLRICHQCLGVLENSKGRALSEVLSAVRKTGANTAS